MGSVHERRLWKRILLRIFELLHQASHVKHRLGSKMWDPRTGSGVKKSCDCKSIAFIMSAYEVTTDAKWPPILSIPDSIAFYFSLAQRQWYLANLVGWPCRWSVDISLKLHHVLTHVAANIHKNRCITICGVLQQAIWWEDVDPAPSRFRREFHQEAKVYCSSLVLWLMDPFKETLPFAILSWSARKGRTNNKLCFMTWIETQYTW